MKRWLRILATLLSLLSLGVTAIPSFADTPPPVGNRVQAIASRGSFHFSDADTVTNTNVDWLNWVHLDLVNEPDGGVPVQNPKVTLETGLAVSDFGPQGYPVSIGTSSSGVPTYTWDWAGLSVAEPEHLPMSATEGGSVARPHFSGARTVVPEILTGPTTEQAVTFTFRLEEAPPPGVTDVGIVIGNVKFAYRDVDLVQGIVKSREPVPGWQDRSDGFEASWHAPLSQVVIGQNYVFKAVILNTKAPSLNGSPVSKPSVGVMFTGQVPAGVVTASSLQMRAPDGSYQVDFSADNVVDWTPNLMTARYQYHLTQQTSKVVGDQPPYLVEIPATVRIEPEALNLKSNGVFTAFLQLPSPYDVKNVDAKTVVCQGAAAAKANVANDKLVLKFNREDLHVVPGEAVPFVVTGKLTDGTAFVANTTVNVNR